MPQPSPAFRPANQPSITLRLSRICSDLTFRDHPHLSPVFSRFFQESASQFGNAMGMVPTSHFWSAHKSYSCSARPNLDRMGIAVLLTMSWSWFYYPSISIHIHPTKHHAPACVPQAQPELARFQLPETRNPQLPGAPNTAPLSPIRSSTGQIACWNPEPPHTETFPWKLINCYTSNS